MNSPRRFWLAALAIAVLSAGVMRMSQPGADPGAPAPTTRAIGVPVADAPIATTPPAVESTVAADSQKTPVPAPLSLEEQHKEIDRKNMRKLHTAIFAFKKAKGHFPEYLSQLAPDFVEASALHSPRRVKEGGEMQLQVHPDPGNAKPSYGFEFSNVVFRDGRTFAEIKEVQRAEWGDVVPLLRRFGHDKVMNMSYGGELYETALNWEWDPATLDVVTRAGWGPGLDAGKFAVVQVLGASGQPLPNAPVWADGRNYSFDLPNRPFVTDAHGFARIPLGTDLDRTALVLRFEGYGQASPVVAFPEGSPPETHVLKAALARSVGGAVVDAAGQPIADTWLYLKRPRTEAESTGASLGVVKTDAAGRWSAQMHPSDAAAFNVAVGSGGRPPKFLSGQPVDPHAAAARRAVVTIAGPER